ncbi:hypothetical protein HDV02_000671, partial [Globomyces sp. JEL0801]
MSRIPTTWRLYRAKALLGLWDADEAGQIAMSLLRTTAESRNSDAIYVRAKSMHLLDSHAASTVSQFLSQSLQFDPDHKDSRTLFKHIKKLEKIKAAGNDAFKSGDLDGAIAAYSEYLAEDPEGAIIKAKVLSNRAIVYSRMSKYDLVIEDCKSALAILEKICFPKDSLEGKDISNEDKQ